MAKKETVKGSTPNGGVKSTIYYRSKGGKPVDKEQAERCEIVEYDKEGKVVGRTYGMVGSKNREI